MVPYQNWEVDIPTSVCLYAKSAYGSNILPKISCFAFYHSELFPVFELQGRAHETVKELYNT